MDALYVYGGDDTWSASPEHRRDWRIAYRWLENNLPAESGILDVGCFDGGFLEPLIHTYRCCGIEIHPGARSRSEAKGIEIVAADLSDLKGAFDCIAAFDVIEHVESPQRFLKQALSCLTKGGRLLLSTGNLDSLSSRLMGSRYWYCTIAEHIAFISPAWVRHQAEMHGLVIEHEAFFAHAAVTWTRALRDAAVNMLYKMQPGLMAWLRQRGFGEMAVRDFPELAEHPPPWTTAKDHFLVVLRKP